MQLITCDRCAEVNFMTKGKALESGWSRYNALTGAYLYLCPADSDYINFHKVEVLTEGALLDV